MFDISSTFFHSIIDRPGADWRSFYRACYLLSCIKVKQKNSAQAREYLELLAISNPNFPINRLKVSNL
jgi:hypothetical protein